MKKIIDAFKRPLIKKLSVVCIFVLYTLFLVKTLSPTIDDYNRKGNEYNDEGKYEMAIAEYDKALKKDPKKVMLYVNKGLAYERLGNYDLAIVNYKK